MKNNDDVEYWRDLFNERIPPEYKWLAQYGENGHWDLMHRDDVWREIQKYVERGESYECDEYFEYHGFRTFTDAKKYLLSALRAWKSEMEFGIWHLTKFKKSDYITKYWSKNEK